MSGKLDSYLADVDRQAQEQLDTIIRQMTQAQGVTETLKAADPMAWVGRMNNIRNQAAEVVCNDLIYSRCDLRGLSPQIFCQDPLTNFYVTHIL